MTKPKRTERSPEILQNQFRTPKQPTTPAHSRGAKSNITPSPAIKSPATAFKRGSVPPTRSQSTLTQIEFVAQSTHLDNDQLDYITEGQPDATHQRQESARLDNGSESETDYRPPLRTRANLTRFETNDDHPKRRRKGGGMGNRVIDRGQSLRRGQTTNATGSGKGKRKSMEKSTTKRDKTLTQMNFVRRYIPIDESDDNDESMGYIETPRQDSTIGQGPTGQEEKTPKASRRTAKPEPETSSKRSRRTFEQELDLSTGEPLTSGETQDTSLPEDQRNSLGSNMPFTPQKSRKLEIPSSQSPESPGLAIITSSQFRCATLSPTKRKPLNFRLQEDDIVKEESPSARPMSEASQGTPKLKTPTHISPNKPRPLAQEQPISADVARPSLHEMGLSSKEASLADRGSNSQRIQRERTVVYETDADSSASEFEDMEDEHPDLPRAQNPRQSVSRLVEDNSRPPSDDSQELPLPETQPPGDMGFDLPSEPPMSDVSAYYQRVQPATQFPHEPVPNLNTQKLSELFPNEGNTQYPQHRALRPPQNFPGPFSQSQTQSQEPDQTELVPESSPIREQQNSVDKTDHVFQRPRAPDAVVQVESSQPVRREESGSGNVLSRSQLLTSSVMESIAVPNFWMGSQDSVGEPYSLPDQ
ncbi:hypothetical protein N7533_005381 [Penicillium manginii]|uniref:uncharacterized protein n=1 Tax=Penicillium manginii TaxID=203109 RepID=UPI0025474F00|nr:uncharacterized protein N7533_005381 [Penicillium manginii]KAJ5755838.1 hypothetical protein N7533_005381 [Penicillium manginii]